MGKKAGYGRVSTDKKDQINSLENQNSYFEREIEARGYELYDIYLDKGLTGTKLNNRPEFERMLTDAGLDIKVLSDDPREGRKSRKHTVYEVSDREPKFDEIWIKNTSRFARNTLSYEIITLLRLKGVNIFFIEQNINSNDPAQDMMLKLMQIFDEQDSKDKSLKTKGGMAEGAKKNRIRTNPNIYGYTYIPEENRLVAKPDESAVIRDIYEMYASGLGVRRIRNALRSKGVYTRKGNEFSATTITKILENEKYTGHNNPLKLDCGHVFANHAPKVKESYQVIENDRIDQIVSMDLFRKCREQASKGTSSEKKGIYNGFTKYARMLWCKRCGSVLYSNCKGDSCYYICKTKRQYRAETCDCPNVYVYEVDDLIRKLSNGMIASVMDDFRLMAISKIIDKIEYLLNLTKGNSQNSKKEIEAELESIKLRLESYYELYANSRSNKESIKAKIDESESALDKLTEQLNQIDIGEEEIKEHVKSYLDNISELYQRAKKTEPLGEWEVRKMIDKIVVGGDIKNKKYEVFFKLLDDMVIELNELDDGHVALNGGCEVDKEKIRSVMRAAETYVYGKDGQKASV